MSKHSFSSPIALVSLALLVLPICVGCSGKRYSNVEEYRATHPNAKQTETVYDLSRIDLATATDADMAKATTKIVFTDNVPSITADGVYSVIYRTDTFALWNGDVTDFSRKEDF
jgi:hypothetical protein